MELSRTIENYRELRASLSEDGYDKKSETDAEVAALLAQNFIEKGASPFEAAIEAVRQIEGAFALAFLFEGERDLIVVARKGSPLAVGIGDKEMFVGSDAWTLASLTNKIVYLEDGDIASVSRDRLTIIDSEGVEIERTVRTINIEYKEEELSFDHINRSRFWKVNGSFEREKIWSIVNSDSITIYLMLISLEEQIKGFIEKVRGSNSMNPDFKSRYITFLVKIQRNVEDLSSSLPDAGRDLDQGQVEVTASYLEKYWAHLLGNIEEYLSPKRTAGLTVPLGIVAMSTGIGTIFGQPIIGSILGAWLAGKVSPEKVVGKILEGSQSTPGIR